MTESNFVEVRKLILNIEKLNQAIVVVSENEQHMGLERDNTILYLAKVKAGLQSTLLNLLDGR